MERFAALIGLLFVLFAHQVQCSDSEEEQYVIAYIRNSGCLEQANVTLEEALSYSLEKAEADPRLQCYISCRLEQNRIIRGCEILIVPDETREETFETYESCKIASEVSKDDQCACGFQWQKCVIDLLKHLFRMQN